MTNQYGVDVTDQPRHQANLNPIRYRGYHYDAELNMYWLTTRFYDPETGRFINADGQINDSLFGGNLYAYCTNDPVNGHDPTGTCAHNTMGFDCSSCRRANAESSRPQYFDPNSSRAPQIIRPIEDFNFGMLQGEECFLVEEKIYIYDFSSADAKALQTKTVSGKIQYNDFIDDLGDVADLALELATKRFGAHAYLFGKGLLNVVKENSQSHPEDVFTLPGTYTITIAIYVGENGYYAISRIDGPEESSINRGWAFRGAKYGVDIDAQYDEIIRNTFK